MRQQDPTGDKRDSPGSRPSTDEVSAAQAATQVIPGPSPPAPDTRAATATGSAGKRVIKQRFELESRLGAGGMGTVYRARDLRKVEARDRDPWVAIKLLNEDFREHPSALISLQREARKSQALTHPNIVKVFDFDRDGDTVFMTMELLRGQDLKQFIAANPAGIALAEVLQLTRELGSALRHAHQQGIMHADLTPRNVFLTHEGTVKVLDFGIAQAIAYADTDAAPAEQTVFDPASLGALTPGYASLERLDGDKPVPADDIYALGCLVYELLKGVRPYDGVTASVAAARNLRPTRPQGLPGRQWRALQKAIALPRAQRYQEISKFLDDFLPRRRKTGVILAMAAGMVLLIMLAAAYQSYTGARQRETATAELAAKRQALEQEQARSRQAVDQDLERINREYMDWAESLIDSSQFSEAQEFLDRVRGETAANPRRQRLQEMLDTASKAHRENLASQEKMRSETGRLLALAEQDISAGRLLQPPGNNAYGRYRQVIALDPDNARAANLLQTLVQQHLDSAYRALRGGQLRAARDWLEGLAEIAPGHRSLPPLRAELEQALARAQERDGRIATLLQQARSAALSDDAKRRESLYLQVLALDPENDQATQGLAQARQAQAALQLREQERATAEAQALLTRARQLLDQRPASATNYQQAYAALLAAQRASPGLQQVTDLIEQMPRRYISEIQAQLAAGEYDETEALLKAATLLSPEDRQLDLLQEELERLRLAGQPLLPASF